VTYPVFCVMQALNGLALKCCRTDLYDRMSGLKFTLLPSLVALPFAVEGGHLLCWIAVPGGGTDGNSRLDGSEILVGEHQIGGTQ
jgi:hypothetical protein